MHERCVLTKKADANFCKWWGGLNKKEKKKVMRMCAIISLGKTEG